METVYCWQRGKTVGKLERFHYTVSHGRKGCERVAGLGLVIILSRSPCIFSAVSLYLRSWKTIVIYFIQQRWWSVPHRFM